MNEEVQKASASAVSASTDAAEAIERSRIAQNEELVRTTAERTKAALLEGLREVFSNDNDKSPKEMSILIQRVPIICTSIMQMHDDIKSLKDTQMWVARLIIGAVILAILKLIFLP